MFAFFVLSTSPGVDIKQFGIGLAAGIIFDATVIRALLVPVAHAADRRLELVAAAVGRQGAVPQERAHAAARGRVRLTPAELRTSGVRHDGPGQRPRPRNRPGGASGCSADRRRACWAYVASTDGQCRHRGRGPPATIAFFRELGLELEGRATIEGDWAGRVTGLGDQRVEIAMMRTPDGHSRLELSRFLTPPVVADHRNAPVNALGYLRVMFAVDDIDDTLARLRKHGAQLVGEVVQYEDVVSALLHPRARRTSHRAGRAARLTPRLLASGVIPEHWPSRSCRIDSR